MTVKAKLEMAAAIAAIVGAIVGLLAWLMPFAPIGTSPLAQTSPTAINTPAQKGGSSTPTSALTVVVEGQPSPTVIVMPPTPTKPLPTTTKPPPPSATATLPKATATVSQVRDYQRISLQNLGTPENSNLGLNAGTNYLLDIPFDTGWTVTTQAADRPDLPAVIQIDRAIARPINVYLLFQAGWGMREFAGKEIGAVTLGFSDGRRIRAPLTLGFNIQDWSRSKSEAVNTATSPTLREAWRGTAPDGTTVGGMDMLTIEIPSEYRPVTLTSIQIADTSVATAGSQNPCIHLLAVTVEHFR